MNKRVQFHPTPVSKAIGTFAVLLAASVVHAGPGFGDAYTLKNAPFIKDTYFANSPSGARAWVDDLGVPDALTGAPDGYDPANRAAYKGKVQQLFPSGYQGTGRALRKFVDPLPVPARYNADGSVANAVTMNATNRDGSVTTVQKWIPVAKPTAWVKPDGSTSATDQYLEVAVIEFKARMHGDLASDTTLRGYIQIDHEASNGRTALPGSKAVALSYPNGAPILIAATDAAGKRTGGQVQAKAFDQPHPLGPVINATQGVPLRVKFLNLLPVGRATLSQQPVYATLPDGSQKLITPGVVAERRGDLFLPVDPSIVGAGFGPDGIHTYTQNRVNVHLHGGDTPWISDGTPHQWITPAGEADAAAPGSVAAQADLDPTLLPNFLRGASAANVPDMPDPGPGAMTYYFPNGQSARMEWYHDHTIGITRLNVYAGIVSAYNLTDDKEKDLVARGVLPDADHTLPLIITDKTFVPDDIKLQDARWSTDAWGQPGDLWYPHVYETVQDPNQATNFNAVGRWHWGPWFWPVFPSLYELPSGVYGDVTTVPEAWGDTPLVNGVAYPVLEVEPRAYRLRVLNATNDRMVTFNMFVADGSQVSADGRADTEVAMIPTRGAWANPCAPGETRSTQDGNGNWCAPETWPVSGWGHAGGVPDFAAQGPRLLQIGNEGGLLPGVAAKDPTPINYLEDKGRAAVLNVLYGMSGLHLGNAERADLVVDFAQYAGKTLLVYNDSGAPVPAADPRNEYFPGVGDQSATGGAEDTRVGFGPNTRTMMQIRVKALLADGSAPAADGNGKLLPSVDEAALDQEVKLAYAATQEKPIVAQAAYNDALGTTWNDEKAYARIWTGSLKEPTFNFVPGTPGAAFNSVLVSDQGGGYIRTPGVSIGAPNDPAAITKTQATAKATLKIDRLHVINGGSGYRVAPVVTVTSTSTGSGAMAASALKLSGALITNGGSGYANGGVTGVTLGNAGSYQVGVRTVTVSNGGRYAAPATVTFSAPDLPGGVQATGTPIMSSATGTNRRVTGVTITNAGSGYSRAPTLTFSNGTTRAAGTATVHTAPTVSFPAPAGGTAATATLAFNFLNGTVTGVTLTGSGTGYTAAPSGIVSGGTAISAAAVTADGVTTLPTLTLSAPPGVADPAARATAVPQVDATGKITGITVTNPGYGYAVMPSITVTGASTTKAVLTATGSVASLTLTVPDPTNPLSAGGGGYADLSTLASEPNNPTPGLTITMTAPTTAGVTATAGATGKVFDVTLTTSGQGYVGAPTVAIDPPPAGHAVMGALPTWVAPTTAIAAADTANGGAPQGSILVKTKAIQELFEPTYGRLNATLGVEIPYTSALTQTTIPLGYVDAPTEEFSDGETQIWKITHNGVDSHPVHFHLLNVQLINRVGWDNFIDPPEPNERGWKETVKMSPLEDVIVAVRAKKPKLGGFGLPNSSRLLDPTQPEGAMTGFTQIDGNTGLPAPMYNQLQSFGWEYVWHCHILGHEENDFMRPIIFNANEALPLAATGLTAVMADIGQPVALTWTDNSVTEFQYQVQYATTATTPTAATVWNTVDTLLANTSAYTVAAPNPNATFFRVVAIGQAGATPSAPVSVIPLPVAPSGLSAAPSGQAAALSWTDNATNETGWTIQRAEVVAGVPGAWVTVTPTVSGAGATGIRTATDSTVAAGLTYIYQVAAVNAGGASAFVASTEVTVAAALAAPGTPGTPSVTAVRIAGNTTQDAATVTWTAPTTGGAVATYTVRRCTPVTFFGITTCNMANVATGLTTLSFTQNVARNRTYRYQVIAVNATGSATSATYGSVVTP